MEDLVIIESNDYSQVVFDDVLECYSENTDLECYFALNELLKPDATDFIGIYKVGFAGLKDCLVSQQINIEAIGETNKGKVVFAADKVPKDDGEFYQFVYVSLGKHIRGASIPFQFKRTHINDYVQIDDQEQVIIKSKESEINETLNDMKARCINLTQANEDYERLIKENEDLIKLLKEEINLVKARCGSLSMENEHLNHELSGKVDNLKLLRETVGELADENKKIKNKYDNLINENRNLGDLLQKRINQVEILKTELESIKTSKSEIEMLLNLKEQELSELRKEKEEFIRLSDEIKQMNVNDKISKLEIQVDDRVNELNKIKFDLKHNEELISEQQQTIQVILTERDSLNAIIQKLQKEKKDLEASHETLSQELLVKNDKLKQVEECKEVLRNQLVTMTNEIEIANERLKENSTELYKISDCEKRYAEENKRLLEEIETSRNEFESKLEQIRGSNYALNLAHQHLENRVRTLSNKHENEFSNERVKSDKLREENENLKQRIYSGAYEYTILHKKYLKLKNYIFNKIQSNELIINKQQQSDNGSKSDDVNSNNKSNELLEDLLDEQTKSELSTFGCSSSSSVTTTPSPSSYNITPHDDNSIRKTLYLPLNTTPSTHYSNYQYNCHIPSPATIINNTYLNDVNKAIHQLETIDQHKCLNKEQHQNIVHHILTPSTSSATISMNNNRIESSACEICGHVFPKDVDACDFSEHLTSHFGPSCPVCFLTFRKGYPQDEFETHVNGHFTN